MFASLPKIADKAFVIAFLVPTLAFGLALAFGFPELSLLDPIRKAVGSQKSIADVTVAVVAVWFCALALFLANRPIYRAMEGYFGPLANEDMRTRQRRLWRAAERQLDGLRDAYEALPQGPERRAGLVAYNAKLGVVRRHFPLLEKRVLPTRFGNINRAFEDYPESVYGVDAIVVWPRLGAVVPSAFQSALTDARASVDCFLNVSALATLFGLLEFGRFGLTTGQALWRALPEKSGEMWPLLVGTADGADGRAGILAAGALALAYIAQLLLIDRALALGDQFKAAFDLYLGGLPKQLGYVFPDDPAGQRSLWAKLRRSFAYSEPAPIEHRLTAPPAAEDEHGAGHGGAEVAAVPCQPQKPE
jgi:hypothetical protein